MTHQFSDTPVQVPTAETPVQHQHLRRQMNHDMKRAALCRARWRMPAFAALCLLLSGLALSGAPSAWALNQRGHVFGFSFGSEGQGAGEFRFDGVGFKLSEPAGIAVDEASGDLYVLDRGNDSHRAVSPEARCQAANWWARNSLRPGAGASQMAKRIRGVRERVSGWCCGNRQGTAQGSGPDRA